MPENEEKPKLHIDADWKAQAQAEKERLREKEKAKEVQPEQGKLPEASFSTLVDTLAYQALSGLGIFSDKATGGVMIDLPGSKFSIDLLSVLEEKTKNNLTDEEKSHIERVLSELRSRFVQIATLVEQSQREGKVVQGDEGAASPQPQSPEKQQGGEEGGPTIETP